MTQPTSDPHGGKGEPDRLAREPLVLMRKDPEVAGMRRKLLWLAALILGAVLLAVLNHGMKPASNSGSTVELRASKSSPKSAIPHLLPASEGNLEPDIMESFKRAQSGGPPGFDALSQPPGL